MTELSDEAKALLEREAHLDEASEAEVEALRLRMVAMVAAMPPPPLGGAPHGAGAAASSSAGALGGATVLKLGVVALVAVAGGSALWLSLSRPSEAPQLREVKTPASAAPTVATSTSTSAAAKIHEAAPSAESPAKPAGSPLDQLGEEAQLVAVADSQLRDGRPATALELYERHLQKYPSGALRRESSAGRLMALCALGKKDEAQPEVERLVAERPGNPFVERVLRVCGSH